MSTPEPAAAPTDARLNPPPHDEKKHHTEPSTSARDPEAPGDGTPVSVGSSKASTFGERPSCFRNSLQEVSFVFIATVAMATNTFLTGSTVVITAAVGADLNMSQSQISWIAAAATALARISYVPGQQRGQLPRGLTDAFPLDRLTAGAFQLALGQLSDLLGRKIMLLSGFGAFSAGCLIVAFAQNAYWVNILCGVLGLASAMVVPPAIGILGAAYAVPSRRKNIAFACFSSGNPLGFALGSITSGVATRIFDWRAGFILLAIIWAVLCVLSYWVVPSVEAYDPASTLSSRLGILVRTFDLVGMLTTVLGVGLLTTALTLGPADGWRSAHVIAMMIIGFLLLVAFVYWESYWPHPLMPLHVWRDRTFSLLIVIAVLGVMAFMSSNFWLSLLLQEVRHMDALEVAVQLLPQVIAGILWNVVAASTLHRIPNSILMAVGALAYVVGSVLLAVQDAHSSYWAFAFPSLVITVIGADFHFNVANVSPPVVAQPRQCRPLTDRRVQMYVMQALPSHQQSLAGGIYNMLLRLGTTLSIGISTAVYSSVDETQGESDDDFMPFRSAFYVSVGFATVSCLFLPLLRLGTQGNAVRPDDDEASIRQEHAVSGLRLSPNSETDIASAPGQNTGAIKA
ncbi:hypothetical protein S7711_00355 [Stachybotrys chartarum IBT 7711]|uniref:Major facilitator superfamily (MFS) profile domain-containing protein n=1 Tax=Stachybotrys chartarum (strain CBS 109288 / IBT 7711) TaxID=1280523 RepID=A0A084B9G7_STACB|nr:hypothetical protein S7711_00355 [Stachybotrys chartarum IBT 7711]